MRMIWNKGHRIRASDKHLVYHFSIGMLLFVFVAVLLLLNIKQLMRTDWEHFSLLENGLTLSPYNSITILIATGVCALVAFLYYRFCYDIFCTVFWISPDKEVPAPVHPDYHEEFPEHSVHRKPVL